NFNFSAISSLILLRSFRIPFRRLDVKVRNNGPLGGGTNAVTVRGRFFARACSSSSGVVVVIVASSGVEARRCGQPPERAFRVLNTVQTRKERKKKKTVSFNFFLFNFSNKSQETRNRIKKRTPPWL